MVLRRRVLAALGVTIAGGTAGCTDLVGFLAGEELAFEATAAAVSDDALAESGYDEHAIEPLEIVEPFSVGGQTREVRVTNWQSEYDKAVELVPADAPGAVDDEIDIDVDEGERARAAFFTALSTPQVSVLGQEFNPVADWDAEEIAEQIQNQYDDVEGLQAVDETEVTVLGESTSVTRFEGKAHLLDPDVTLDLVLHVGEAIEHAEDFVVPIGGYPLVVDDVEEENVFRMMQAIEHNG